MAVIAKIRKHAGLAVALIGIAIIGFVVQDAFGRRGQQAPPVAVINGETVSYNQFTEQVEQITEQYKRAQGEDVKISEEDMVQIRAMAWQRIMGEYLLDEAASRIGINVPKAEMNDMYYGKFISRYLYPYFTNPQTGVYDRQQVMNLINNFDQLSEQDQKSLLDLERIIKSERLREKYYGLLAQSYYMPAAMAQYQLESQGEVYTARFVSCPYTDIQDADITLSKSDYQKFYNGNKYRFRQNKSRTIDYVVFDVTPTPEDMAELNAQVASLYEEFRAEENVADFVNAVTSGERFDSIYRNRTDIFPGWDTLFQMSAGQFVAPRRMGKTFQMAKLLDVQMRPDSLHVSHIVVADRHLADSLAGIINTNPSLFATLAAQNSLDPSAAQNGGDLGWQKDGYFIGFLNRAILATPAGKATVVDGPNGHHILYVNEKTKPVKKVLAAVVVVPVEPSTATTKEIYTLANQLLGQSKGTTAGLDSAAARMGLRIRQGSVTELENALPGVQSAREIIRWAFNKDSKEGRIADRVFEMENRYVIAGLRSINETDYMKLDRAMQIPQVEFMVKQEKKFEQCAAKMASANTLEELASALNTDIDTAMGITVTSYPMMANGAYEPAVIGTICGTEQGRLSKPVKGNAGTYRIVVDEIMPAQVNPMQVEIFRQRAQSQFMQSAANYIGTAMEQAATVKDNRGFYF